MVLHFYDQIILPGLPWKTWLDGAQTRVSWKPRVSNSNPRNPNNPNFGPSAASNPQSIAIDVYASGNTAIFRLVRTLGSQAALEYFFDNNWKCEWRTERKYNYKYSSD
jgi:uncharacterized protein